MFYSHLQIHEEPFVSYITFVETPFKNIVLCEVILNEITQLR